MPTFADPNLMIKALAGTGPTQVGEVIKLPIGPWEQGIGIGPTNRAADYVSGRLTDPQVLPMPKELHLQWLQNMARKYMGTLPK